MPPPRPQTHQPPPLLPPAPVTVAQEATNVFELIKQFVHPDRRHVLERHDGQVPLPPIKPVPLPSALSSDEARRRVESLMLFRGENIVITPHDLQIGRPALPSVPPLVSSRPAVAVPEPIAVQRTERTIRETSHSIAVPQLPKIAPAPTVREPASDTSPVSDPNPAPAQSGQTDAPPQPVRKKRKHALALVPSASLAERTCATPECFCTIPAKFQGALCVQCDFVHWQN
ncbi:hypothetical protein C8T65DRAFT_55107 [Cerioporus squamosus]|nr:hypothetical protein C8T65DRAFT_55107 [Cerioporus squamosus]